MQNKMKTNEVCPLCLEEISNKEEVVLPCKHLIHRDCLEMMEASQMFSCAICRQPIFLRSVQISKEIEGLNSKIIVFATLEGKNDSLRRNNLSNENSIRLEIEKASRQKRETEERIIMLLEQYELISDRIDELYRQSEEIAASQVFVQKETYSQCKLQLSKQSEIYESELQELIRNDCRDVKKLEKLRFLISECEADIKILDINDRNQRIEGRRDEDLEEVANQIERLGEKEADIKLEIGQLTCDEDAADEWVNRNEILLAKISLLQKEYYQEQNAIIEKKKSIDEQIKGIRLLLQGKQAELASAPRDSQLDEFKYHLFAQQLRLDEGELASVEEKYQQVLEVTDFIY